MLAMLSMSEAQKKLFGEADFESIETAFIGTDPRPVTQFPPHTLEVGNRKERRRRAARIKKGRR